MKFYTYLIIIIIFSVSTELFSQEIGVIAGLNAKGKVTVRWFSSEIFNAEGVNIYRKETHQADWQKLNSSPVKKMEKAPENTADTNLAIYSSLLYYQAQDPEDDETIRLSILAKTILDNNFARAAGMQYDDNEVSEGKTYHYKVAALKGENEEYSGVSEAVSVGRYITHAAPADLKGTAGDSRAQLSWKRDPETFFAYNIYRGESVSGNKKMINKVPVMIFEVQDSAGNFNTPEYFYRDTALINGKTYYYEITGIDYLGMESKRSQSLSLLPKDLTPPPAPYDIKNIPDETGVMIIWKSDPVNDRKGFNVYRSREFKGPYMKVNQTIIPAADTSYLDKLKGGEERLYYYVTSEDNSSNISTSLITVAVIPDATPPARPVELRAAGDSMTVVLTWKKGTEKDLLGYFIHRSVTGIEDDFVLLTPRPVKDNKYIDTLKKEATNSFIYKIMAVDRKYNQSEYSASVSVKLKDVVPPSAPYLMEIYLDDRIVTFTWKENNFEGVAGYYIYRSRQQDNGEFRLINKTPVPPAASLFSDSLTYEGVYMYYIVSRDSSGNNSARSNYLTVEYSGEAAFAPVEGLRAVLSPDKTKVNLSWKAVPNKDLLGYIVFREDEEKTEFNNAVSPLQKETAFSDTTAESGKTYYYSVKTFDSKGNILESKPLKFPER